MNNGRRAGPKSKPVQVLRCGVRSTAASILFHREISKTPVKVQFQCWCVQSGDRTILVDVGLPTGDGRLMPIEGARSTKSLLAEGLDARLITDVVVTHLHWDHAGDLDLFANAAIYVQAREIDFVRSSLFRRRALRDLFIHEQKLEWLLANKNLRAVDEDATIAPGVEVRWVGGHTPGSQLVLVDAGEAEYVFTGDVVNTYRNLVEDLPPGIVWNMAEALAALDTVRALQAVGKKVVPSHELLPSIPSFVPPHVVGEGVKMTSGVHAHEEKAQDIASCAALSSELKRS